MTRPPNQFLQALSAADFELLQPHLRPMKLDHAAILFELGGQIEQLYFPVIGAISLVVPLQDGQMIEAGLIGQDGLVGAPAALDSATALYQAIVQIEGEAFSLSAGVARSAVNESVSLRSAMYSYDQMILAQAQQSAACNVSHSIEERLCRWLLRTRDILKSDHLPLTQEFLSQMLGVRRTSVTLVANHLKAIKLIKYRRGLIELVDPEGLLEAACECYGALKLQEARLLRTRSN
jgi:CRP-like cAMP-binding protein